MYGANRSCLISTLSKKNFTHLVVCSLQLKGLLLTVASMFNAHVENSDKSTVEAKSVKIGGETELSMTLKSTILLEHAMLPLTLTIGRVRRRVMIILYMVFGSLSKMDMVT